LFRQVSQIMVKIIITTTEIMVVIKGWFKKLNKFSIVVFT